MLKAGSILISLWLLITISYCDELYTIKPDGGGSYTTLQAAETAQDGDLSGRGVVTFECYDGTADLAECTVDGWTNNDSSNYLRIFVPLAERHDGTSASAGAWIDVDTPAFGIDINENYTRIEGVRFNMDWAAPFPPAVCIRSVANFNNVLIDSNLFVGIGENASSIYLYFQITGDTITGLNIINNIIYGKGIVQTGMFVETDIGNGLTANIQNNTINSCVKGILMNEGGAATLTLTLENNICTNNATADFEATITNGTISGNNNCSEDDTADNWDGSGSIINQTVADLFVTEGSDHTLKAGSNALDVGKTIATFDNDALHLETDDWRPQGTDWDIGALELYVPTYINIKGGTNILGSTNLGG